MKLENIRFIAFGLVVTLAVVIMCVRLGNWQYSKAQLKQQLQSQLDQRMASAPVDLPAQMDQPEQLRYLSVNVRGVYLPEQQFLLDNQVYQDKAGYYVMTPLRVAGREQIILVNRGWLAKDFNQSQLPQVAVPSGEQQLAGHLWLPPSKIYRLGNQTDAADANMRQALDMGSIAKAMPAPLMPMILRLQQAEANSGLLVDWPRPDDRIATHLGYTYQWYGFAVAAVLIFLVTCWRRRWK